MKNTECCGCTSRPLRKAWTKGRESAAPETQQQMAGHRPRFSCTSPEAISYNESGRHLTTPDTGRSMEDFQQKRRLIEQGQLTSWARRGRGAFTVEHMPFHRTLLQTVFRVEWLRARGERNARNAVVKKLRFTFDSLP